MRDDISRQLVINHIKDLYGQLESINTFIRLGEVTEDQLKRTYHRIRLIEDSLESTKSMLSKDLCEYSKVDL